MTLQRFFERFLAWCVRRSFRRERPRVIGVAGSVGKSSTKAAIGIALGAHEKGSRVAVSQKNFNSELGVPLAVFGCDLPHRSVFKWLALLSKGFFTAIGVFKLRGNVFVLELGTDKPGDLAHLLTIVRPSIGVLTAIGPEHTEFFGSVERVADEEALIVTGVPPDGVAVMNQDDPLSRSIASELRASVFTFGSEPNATVCILSTSVCIEPDGSASSGLDVRIVVGEATHSFRLLGTVGRPQAYAAAAALAVAHAVGEDIQRSVERLASSFHGMPGRMRLIEGIKRTWIIDDSYNSSPLAALSAIRDLASFPVQGPGRRIAAMGDMLELGSLAESSHADIGKAAFDAGIDMLVTCGTLAHVVARAALDAGMSEDSVFTFAKSPEAGLFIQERYLHSGV